MKSQAHLSSEQIQAIRHERVQGHKLDDIAQRYGSNRQQISAICLNQIYKPAQLVWPLPNLWLGVSAENQPTLDARWPWLRRTPAAVRFLSLEPLLASISLLDTLGVVGALGVNADGTAWGPVYQQNPERQGQVRPDWCIVGGESGPHARPCDLDWLRSVVQQCQAAAVACWVKQLGSNAWPDNHGIYPEDGRLPLKDRKGADPTEWPADLQVQCFPEVRHA